MKILIICAVLFVMSLFFTCVISNNSDGGWDD